MSMVKLKNSIISCLLLISVSLIVACSGGGGSSSGASSVAQPVDSATSEPENPGDNFIRPNGIYLLSVRNSVNEIRDLPFVDGFVLRTSWTMLESSEDNYDFSSLDPFIEALDQIEQKLSLTIFSQRVPQYVLDNPAVVQYQSVNQNNNGQSFMTAVPWDEFALARYEKFMQALGDHLVMSIDAGAMLPLRDHPVLRVMGIQIVGLGGLRDPLDAISSQPSYTREVFTSGSLQSMQIAINQFFDQSMHVAIFGIADDENSPPLDDFIVSEFMTNFNAGSSPQLGFFAENLACETPNGGSNDYLFANKESTHTMFQMLQAWQDTFQNPDRTDICLTETDGPSIAMQYAFDTFNTRYFEVYPADLNHAPFAESFQRFHDFLQTLVD
ncbi:MAG: hypothetical protein KUG79_07140 [Pseudomonadales bacterium]|nr:hypothetical protein [Pseudomonadales bacterium]